MYRTSEKTSLSRKMAELEDRWRKSQEDRFILELKFKEVLKGLADKNEGSKLLKLREKYHRFLENEDKRNERNDHILRALDKIESQANMLSAKTERLKLLKLHYEAYMKRMYPAWKLDNGEVDVTPQNKESIFHVSNKHEKRNATYHSPGEERMASRLSHDIPRYCEKSYYNSNNVLQTHSPNALDSGNAIPSQTKREKNRLLTLNHDISNIDLNSKEKSDNSRGLSFELEENTSKDLLNVSLSDDIPVNDSTMPVDKGRPKDSSQKESTVTGSKDIEIDNSVNHTYPLNSYDDYANNVSGNNNLVLNGKIKEEVSNETIVFGGGQSYNNNANGIQNDRTGYPTGKEQDVSETLDQAKLNENIEVGAYQSEFKPSVMITQPTPDIGESSLEEDLSKKEMLTQDDGAEKERCLSSHENSCMASEAEASDGERIEGESSGDFGKVKHSPVEELSPKSTAEVGSLQGNIENDFKFSSSDADYEELENQMAALIEGKRNDKSIPKVVGNSKFQKVSRDELQAGEVDNAEEEISQPSKDVESNKDIYDEDQIFDVDDREKRFGNKISMPNTKHTDFKATEYGNIQEMENKSMEIIEQGHSDNKNQGDEEKHNETFGSSIDVNSEILDEDHHANADETMLQPEEGNYEFSDNLKVNSADEDNFRADNKIQGEFNAPKENTEQVEYDRDNNEEEDRLEEFENEVERDNREYNEQKDLGEPEYVEDNYQNEQDGDNRDLGSIKEDSKHDEIEQYGTNEINEQHGSNIEENHGEHEERNYEEDNHDIERDTTLHEIRENTGNKDVYEEFDEYGKRDEEYVAEENHAINEESEELGQGSNEDWENGKYEQGDTTKLREEENYTRQQEIEEEVYERPDLREQDDRGYERHAGEQDEERNYETEAAEEHTREDYESNHDVENQEQEYENHSREKQDKLDYDEGHSVENERDQYEGGNDVVEEPEEYENRNITMEKAEYEKHEVHDENNWEVEQHERLDSPVPEQEEDLYERENEQSVTHERLEDETVITNVGEDEIDKEREIDYENIREMQESRLGQGNEEIITEEIHTEEGDIRVTYEKDIINEENQNSGKYEEDPVKETIQEIGHIEEIGHDLNSGSTVSEKEILPQKIEIIEDKVFDVLSSGEGKVENVEKNSEEMLDVEPQKEVVVSESKTEKNSEELLNVEPQKEMLVNEPKKDIVTKEVIKAEAKDNKKLPEETAKDKKEAVKKSTEPAVAEHHMPEKHERNVKESTNMAGRPLSRQYGKKDYDPHKVEKLKSTIRKFQLKKDSKLDKPGRKQTESKK